MAKGEGDKAANDNKGGIKIEHWPVEQLQPYDRNPRTHDDGQLDKLVASMREFGFTNPIMADDQGIVAGHGRWMAASRIYSEGGSLRYPDGTEIPHGHVPVINCSGWSAEQRKAYIIADNRLALDAGWDDDLLGELQAADYDLSLTGFDDDELADLLPDGDEPPAPRNTDPEDAPPVEAVPASRCGDVWRLGRHRLMCGDSTSTEDLDQLLAGERAALLWTDPPYNVNYEGKAGKILNDHMSDDDFSKFLRAVFVNAFCHMVDGAPIYVAHADAGPVGVTFRREFMTAGFYMASCLVWRKNSFTLGRSDYHWQHEPILYGWKPGAAHRWYGERDKTTVLEQPGSHVTRTAEDEIQINLGESGIVIRGQGLTVETIKGSVFLEEKPHRNSDHPTMKPVALVRRMVENSSEPGDIVLDLFGGSGSTLIACDQSGRSARLMELDPRFVDVIVKRWQDLTGRTARLEATGQSFEDVREARAKEGKPADAA